jgi:hypothetical protein
VFHQLLCGTSIQRCWLPPAKFFLESTVASEIGISVLSHISIELEFARNKVWGSTEHKNVPCSSYPSLLHLRRHFPLTEIGAPLSAAMFQSMLPTYNCFQDVSCCICNRFDNILISYHPNNLQDIFIVHITNLNCYKHNCMVLDVKMSIRATYIGDSTEIFHLCSVGYILRQQRVS